MRRPAPVNPSKPDPNNQTVGGIGIGAGWSDWRDTTGASKEKSLGVPMRNPVSLTLPVQVRPADVVQVGATCHWNVGARWINSSGERETGPSAMMPPAGKRLRRIDATWPGGSIRSNGGTMLLPVNTIEYAETSWVPLEMSQPSPSISSPMKRAIAVAPSEKPCVIWYDAGDACTDPNNRYIHTKNICFIVFVSPKG